MTKEWITGIGLMVVGVAVVAVLISDETFPHLPGSSGRAEPVVAVANVQIKTKKIAYEKSAAADVASTSRILKPAASKQKTPKDPKVKYQTTDSSGRYGIQLIDEANLEVAGGATVGFVGSVNGRRFVVRVPKSVQLDDLKLRIVDRKTKVSKTVSVPFVADLGKPGYAPEMKIDFDDAQNYIAESNPQVAAVFP